MKQANVSLGDTSFKVPRSSYFESNSRRLIVDSSPSSDDEAAWNHSADYTRRVTRHKDAPHSLRRPASEIQIRCCRSATMGRSCNCPSARDAVENIDHSEKELLTKIATLTNHVQELQIKEVALLGKLRLLKEEAGQKDSTIVELQSQVTTLMREKDAAEIKATSFTHNVQVLEARIEEYKNNSTRADEKHADKLCSTVKSLESLQQSFELERRKWQTENKSLVTQLEESNSERQQLLKKFEDIKSQHESAVQEKESLLKEKTDGVFTFTRDLTSAKEKILKLETQLSSFDSLKAENSELKKQNTALRRQMDETYGQLVEHQLRQFSNLANTNNNNNNTEAGISVCEFNNLPNQKANLKVPANRRTSTSSTVSSTSSALSCGDLLTGQAHGGSHGSDSTLVQTQPASQQLLARVDALVAELRLSNGKFQLEHEKCVKLETTLKKMENETDHLRQVLEQTRKQLAEKRTENESTLAEFFEVRNKLHSSVEQLGKDTEEIDRLEKELKNTERELAKKSAEIEKLKQAASTSASLQARLSEAEQLARRFADECDQRQLKIDQMSLQLDNLFDSRHGQRVAYEEQIEALRQEITRLTSECRSKTDLASNFEVQIKKLEGEVVLVKKAIEQTKRGEALLRVEMETGYVNAQSEFMQKYQKLENALRETTANLKEADDQKEEFQSKLDSLVEARDHHISELEQLLMGEKSITEQRSAEVTSLTSALREKEKSLARAQRRINDLESGEVRLQEQLSSVGQEMANARAREEMRICELETSNQKLSEQLAKADRLNADQTARANQLQNQVVTLERNCESAVEKYAELEAKLVEAEGERVKLKSEQEVLATNLQEKLNHESSFRRRLEDISNELEATKRLLLEKDSLVVSLESDCHALAGRVESVEEARRVTAKTAEEFKRLADDQADKIYCLENQLAEKAEELRDITAELRQRDAEMGLRRDQVFELESRVDGMRTDLETRIQRLEEALEQAQGELCAKITETTQLTNELASCQAELAHFREVDEKFSGEVDALRADTEEKKRLAIGWKKKFDKSEADRQKLDGRIKELENALSSVQTESSKLKQEIQSQVTNVLSVKAETDAFRREVSNTRSEVSRLREELAQKEDQLSMAKAQAVRFGEELESVRKQKSTLHEQLLVSIEQMKRTKAKMALKYEQQLRDLRLQNSILLNCDPAISPPPGNKPGEKPINNKFLNQFLPPSAAELIGGMMSPERLNNDSSATSPFFNSPPSAALTMMRHRSLLGADSTSATDNDVTKADDEASTIVDAVEFSFASHAKLPGEHLMAKHRSAVSSASKTSRPPLPRKK